jgi:hypothetical protein
MSYNIYMRYNPEQPSKVSKYNKDIVEFINKNIDQINSTGIEIVLSLIDEDDTEALKLLQKKGVSKLPALLGRGIKEPIQKTDKIKKFLLSNAKTKKSIPVKNGDEELRDYQWDIMDQDDEEDESKRTDAEIRARVEYEQKRRSKRGQSNDKPATAAEIIAQQRRSRGQRVRNRPAKEREPDPEDDPDDEPEEDAPKNRRNARRPTRRDNMDPDPVDILDNTRPKDQEEAMDNDLMSKFWSGRGVSSD